MVKRLFKLIWEKHFKLPWDNNVQQSISFLFNRRGFTFLTENYSKDVLKEFPKSVYNEHLCKKLPEQIKKHIESENTGTTYDLDSALMEWSQSDEGINILKFLLDCFNKFNQLNQSKESKKSKDFVWNFNISKFDIEKADFEKPDEDDKKHDKKQFIYKKTHLHHLFFAINKIYTELQSGSRHRSKYFKEVEDVLKDKKHTHRYLKNFCKKLHLGSYNISVKELSNLVGHLSNFELKPLRKYFNTIKYKKGDCWDKSGLSEIFNNWILNEWRVNPQKK